MSITSSPVVYVVTVCRNAEALMDATMQSVLGQTYAEMRYVVVDGASTDGTVDVINRYPASRYPRIVAQVSEPDRGIYDAMNKALRLVRWHMKEQGTTVAWVNFMNAGDSFVGNDVLEKVFVQTEVPDGVKVVGGHTNLIYPDHIDFLSAAGPDALLTELPYCHQSTFVRVDNDFLWQFDLRYRIAADYHLFYSIYWKYGAKSMLTVNCPIAAYRMDGSTTFSHLRRAKGEYLTIQSAHKSLQWWKEWIKYHLHIIP